MSDAHEADLAWLRSAGEETIKETLLTGFERNFFQPLLSLHTRTSYTVQIHALYVDLEGEHKAKVKKALLRAILEWDPTIYPPELLQELLFLASYIRASQVVNYFRLHLDRHLVRHVPSVSFADVLAVGFAVVAGFIPHEEAVHLLQDRYERSLSDPKLARYAATMMIGLCKNEPWNYPTWLMRFRQYAFRYPHYYRRLDAIFGELLATVGPRVLLNRLGLLDGETRLWFGRVLRSMTELTSLDPGPDLRLALKFPSHLVGSDDPIELDVEVDLDQQRNVSELMYTLDEEEIVRIGPRNYLALLVDTISEPDAAEAASTRQR